MSDLSTQPAETRCGSATTSRPVRELHPAREVPLGGIRGVRVDRVLPQRTLPTVGAWCFLDQFGPQRIPMTVLPHPHIGLQTVTWPISGEIRHRDSVGSDVLVRPGQLNLMTAGRGVSHSEVSPEGGEALHGLQLWVALPADRARIDPGFEQHLDLPRHETGPLRATVLMGDLAGVRSPATTHSPLLGAELSLAPGRAELPVREDFEHAVLVVSGEVEVDGVRVTPGPLLYLGTGRSGLEFRGAAEGTRLLLLGGEPFPDDLVMWWNFVGRDHAEIEAARADWEDHHGRFGVVAGHGTDRIPAPELPGVRLRPRRRS
ncbi:pirin family protein [Actinoalloteichus caeruleus]|uniref:Pirin-related protein n=1 Tax=Actinoalloteichus caeruleus DSM 43889 TaxID=1120930 RepID=A0ABT1JGU1_ACTCY|nr:pirin family protein [Actinoalloteichus caeruleus]MCP2331001.1 hypothetical protein [Actinoalloteichus caeruleus DSM 43889]